MKNLILVRHAKSSWKDADLDDHDRPLNKRGLRDAPFMAKLLKKEKVDPDLIVSSSAERALTTAKEFAEKLKYPKDKIISTREIYLAELDDLVEYARQLSEKNETVMLFGHNPGITLFANYLAGNNGIDNIPTCGICSFGIEAKSWTEVSEGKGKLLSFEYPKKYFKDSDD